MCRAPRLMLILALVLAAAPANAQGRFPPDSLANLKFFPQNTPVLELINRMKSFTSALGVRCQYCHEGREGMPLDSFNFRSDDKRTKLTARVMLEMVQEINGRHLTQIPERPTPSVEVTCMTCHHGAARPRELSAIILETATANGLDSAVKAYRALREQYYGRAAYDFGEQTLGNVMDGLSQARRYDDAVAIAQLNAEFFPTSGQAYLRMGEAYRMKGDTTNAALSYRQAMQKDPRVAGFARRRLTELGQAP